MVQRGQSPAAQPWHFSRAPWCLEWTAEDSCSHHRRPESRGQTGLGTWQDGQMALPGDLCQPARPLPPKGPYKITPPAGDQASVRIMILLETFQIRILRADSNTTSFTKPLKSDAKVTKGISSTHQTLVTTRSLHRASGSAIPPAKFTGKTIHQSKFTTSSSQTTTTGRSPWTSRSLKHYDRKM